MTALVHSELPIRRLKRAEYDQLVRLGCFEGERVELLYGVIVEMSPIGPSHSWAVEQLTLLLVPLAQAGRARVRIQSPMAASDESEPEPDVLISPAGEDPREHPSRALLAIEVADSSLRRDRGVKRALYAEAGVPEYWIVNVRDRRVEVFRDPVGSEYSTERVVADGEGVAPLQFPDLLVEVAALLLPEE